MPAGPGGRRPADGSGGQVGAVGIRRSVPGRSRRSDLQSGRSHRPGSRSGDTWLPRADEVRHVGRQEFWRAWLASSRWLGIPSLRIAYWWPQRSGSAAELALGPDHPPAVPGSHRITAGQLELPGPLRNRRGSRVATGHLLMCLGQVTRNLDAGTGAGHPPRT